MALASHSLFLPLSPGMAINFKMYVQKGLSFTGSNDPREAQAQRQSLTNAS